MQCPVRRSKSRGLRKSKRKLISLVDEREERKYLHSWIECWHKRRSYIFRAFVPFESAPKMNHAELIHPGWVKRDRMNMSLLDAAYADSRYNIQIQVAYKAFVNGAGKCGKGLSLLEKQHKATRDQIRKARQLAEALIREDLCDEDHISALQDQDAHFMSLINIISLQKQCFIFFLKQQCINKMPHWTNLKPSDRIRADSSFTEVAIEAFKDNGLPICNSVE